MASTRGLVLAPTKRSYVCFSCQLRALSLSSRSRATSLACPLRGSTHTARGYPLTTPSPSSHSRPYATDDLPPRPARREDSRRRTTWTDRLRKKLWANGEGPDPWAFKVPGETPEEQAERIREEEEEKLAREKEERDFEDLRKAGEEDRLERIGENSGSKAVELRKGFTIISDDEQVIESEDRDIAQEQSSQSGEFKPATRWRGLRHIPEWKVAQEVPKPLFTGYLAREKVEDRYLIERAVQRALVEVGVLKQRGENLKLPTNIRNPTDDFEDRLGTGISFTKDGFSLKFTDSTLLEDVERSLGLRPVEEGNADVHEENFDHVDEDMIRGYPEEGRRPPQGAQGIVESDPLPDWTSTDSIDSAENVLPGDELQSNIEAVGGEEESRPPLNRSYRRVPFTDSDMKFAVLKRVMQLTGTRVADPVIPRLNNAGDLVRHMVKPAPAKRLIEDLAESKEISKLRNVEIWEKRYTEKDRETEIGRWKLIEAELKKRGLPLDRLERSDRGRMGKVLLKNLVLQKVEVESQRLGDAGTKSTDA